MTLRLPMPLVQYAPAPCPKCGAVREEEAETKCKPQSDETGERYCPGEFDRDGNSVQPTPESIAAIDAWCKNEERRDD